MVRASLLLSAQGLGAEWSVSRVLEHLSPAVAKSTDVGIAERGQGSFVYTSDGRRLLDMACGIGQLSTGHCHPKVVKAIQDQAAQLIMAQQNIFPTSRPQVELLKRLERIMPSHLTRYFFANSGSEAVDNAVKIARSYTGRQNIIAFQGGFHGRTYGAMALTTSKIVYRQSFGPLPPGVVVAPYPYCLQCKARQAAGGLGYEVAPNVPPVGKAYSERVCCGEPQDALQWLMKMQTAPQETAAVIIEPILGEGGFLTPPPGFLAALRRLCDQHGMLLIFDEVQAGMARTGTWWSHEQLGGEEAAPDMMLFAKGIASGFPFAGVATRAELFDKMSPGMMGGTYGGSALGCAAATATIDAIEEEGMMQNARERGLQLIWGLVELSKEGYPITDVRGRGLMVAAEFGGKEGGLAAEAGVAAAVTKACGKRGMLLLTSGARETVRFLPPLNVSEGEVREALGIFKEALGEVFGQGDMSGVGSGFGQDIGYKSY